MTAAAAIALGLKLIGAARDAFTAGQTEISEDQLDAALAEIDASDQRLSDAIERARQRENGQ